MACPSPPSLRPSPLRIAERLKYFFDNCISFRYARMLSALDVDVVAVCDVFDPSIPDIEIFKSFHGKELVFVTADMSQATRSHEARCAAGMWRNRAFLRPILAQDGAVAAGKLAVVEVADRLGICRKRDAWHVCRNQAERQSNALRAVGVPGDSPFPQCHPPRRVFSCAVLVLGNPGGNRSRGVQGLTDRVPPAETQEGQGAQCHRHDGSRLGGRRHLDVVGCRAANHWDRGGVESDNVDVPRPHSTGGGELDRCKAAS